MKRIVILAVAGALSACAAGGSGPTPKASVLTLESGLTAAERLALNYVSLPRCGANAPSICSDPAVVAAIKQRDLAAYTAVTAAQASVDADPTASNSQTQAALASATAGLAAFQAIVPTPPKGN